MTELVQAPGTLAVRMMGRFSIEGPDGDLLIPNGKKSRGILAYLLFQRGKPVSRLRLIDLFWSDRDAEHGRASLRQGIYEIRRLFADGNVDCLVASRETIAIQPRQFRFDLWDSAGDYDPKLNQSFLDDLDPVSPVFDEWLADMRRVIHAAQLKKAEENLAEAARRGDAVAIAEAAATVLGLDKTNEPAACALFQALGEQGKLSTAKAEFDKLKTALTEDGFDISPSTRQVFDRLFDRSAAPPMVLAPSPPTRRPPVVSVLPAPGAEAVDRQTVLSMVDEIGVRLANLHELQTSIADVDDGADHRRALADYALECSAKSLGGKIVCVARLADRRSGVLCWSLRETVSAERFFDQIANVAEQSVPAILAAIERNEMQLIEAKQDANHSAYEHYLRAKFTFFRAGDPSYMRQVQSELQLAIEKDPRFIPAYAHLIQSYNTCTFYTQPGLPLGPSRERALQLAEQLLSLDSRHASAHIAMGWCQLWRRNFAAAERCIETATAIGSHEAHRLNAIGTALVYLGRHEDGARFYDLAQARMLHELDYQRTDYGELHYLQGDYERALSWLEYGESRTRYRTWFWRMLVLAQLGRLADAHADLEALAEDVMEKWAGPRPCQRDEAVRWYLELVPLRRKVDQDLVLQGLAKLGVTF